MGSCYSRKNKVSTTSLDEEEKKKEIKKKKNIYILYGASGSGKDTQCRLLEKKYNYKIICMSKLLKEYKEEYNKENVSNEEGNYSDEIEKCMIDGSLVNDKIVIEIFHKQLNKYINDDKYNGIIINGFPRNYEQALLIKQNNISITKFINIQVGKDTLWRRINNRIIDPITNISYNENIIQLIKKKREGQELSDEEQKQLIIDNQIYNNLSNDILERLTKRKDDEEQVFNKRFQLYIESEQKINSLFKNICKSVDGEKSINHIFDQICSIIDDDNPN
ncbi:adenylate kinase 2 [Plasmodium reichenowi]|uniref:Adenylate kinase 2 n=1 Tax=Plasmodium reichenowi TaxID=5854 RepID=A0A2P9DBW7_PLARE|nr:adenylate kinase 2 [Plasmodium reichenowi]